MPATKKPVLVVTTTSRYPMDSLQQAQFIAAAIRETGDAYFDGWGHYDFPGGTDTYDADVES